MGECTLVYIQIRLVIAKPKDKIRGFQFHHVNHFVEFRWLVFQAGLDRSWFVKVDHGIKRKIVNNKS